MARAPLPPGELGKPRYRVHANGRVYAAAQMRDLAGKLHQLSGAGTTEADALADLQRKARAVAAVGSGERLHAGSTIAEAVTLWLEVQARSPRVAPQSMDRYRLDAKNLRELMGAVHIGDVTSGMISDLLGDVRATKSDAKARMVRRTLSGVMGLAVRRGAITTNPVRDAEPIPVAPRRESALTPSDFRELEKTIEAWGGGAHRGGTKSDWRALRDMLLLCVTTSARINEVNALERRDVLPGGKLRLGPTIVWVQGQGTFRQEYPKGKKRKGTEGHRFITLTPRATEVIERRLESAGLEPTAPLFPNRYGGHLTIDRTDKRMRAFRDAYPELWQRLGIPGEEATTHLMRRSALTAVTRAGSLSLASELGGHSSEAVTRRSYVSPASEVSPTTADLLADF